MSQFQYIGNTRVLVSNDEFANGYQVGYLQHKLDYCSTSLKYDHTTKTLSEMDIYALIVGVITNIHHAGRYHAGYVTGWIAALLEGRKPTVTVPAFGETATEEVNA